MGAIVCLRKMPSKCSECIFADKEVEYCRLRNSSINAGKIRNVRMPLCLLENEGEYLTRKKEQLKRIVKLTICRMMSLDTAWKEPYRSLVKR